jgi:hypothetical protein
MCFPGQDTLAKAIGMSIGSVNAFIKELETSTTRSNAHATDQQQRIRSTPARTTGRTGALRRNVLALE